MLNPAHLVVGDDTFLQERATKAIIDQVDPRAEVQRFKAGEVTEGELLQATSPSLFAEERVVVFTGTEAAGKEPTELLLRAAVDPAPGMTLIVCHSGGGRNKSLVPKFKKACEVHEAGAIKNTNELSRWITNEFRSHNVRPTPDVISALQESVGSDLRELAAAVEQLVADTEGEITVRSVRAYYTGVAEVSGFDIADAAVRGNLNFALGSTRRALQLGISPVAIAAALASKVGDIAKLYSTRGNPDQLAKQLGMHPFVAKKTMQVARNWSGDAVSEAVIIIADLDAEVKGQGGDPDFAIENAVRRIAKLA
ncbi:DNA polymerase III subunit delta [Corynebacterium breve]|uniref:DNA-directed DNA polymerase n=1 Tax=Corynebacterium breve TaxID=3049799 RepID=A0ABY8VDF6_9CORY|nr:DNA polymerase III subunit delta [Corynebacterium breve]WIM67142.1 DNA polymerase III subunit delta [Corynebacterium breve]